MALAQHELCRVLDGDDPFALVDEAREHVEQRRLAGASATRYHDVQPARDRRLQEVEHRLRQRLPRDQVMGVEPIDGEPPDRQRRTIERQRRNDRVDA